MFDRIGVEIEMDRVGVNDKGSIYDAVQYLYSKNLKKIGLVCALGDIGLGQERIEGYTRACKELGLPIDEDYLVVSKDIETVKSKLSHLLETREVEALIGLDFVSTLLTSRTIQQHKLNIPEDIKMIGYVNEDFASFLYPSISYVDQHPVQMGETAATMVINRIKKYSQKTPVKNIIKTELKHLDSTQFKN
ncbi:substrate-binding domain-containing protein [Antarcticibacterium sp. 1MA-6-2]|uniref:substrate-binding domain-containing protein n=1 Tax=Antarcticibacterium sp. 1MA-6-2 TaxID=2908210 RepID=UPI0021083889|nr:substrate-binding domain-containing protein [Antarcticibacterium sp. 1MA-6-2]